MGKPTHDILSIHERPGGKNMSGNEKKSLRDAFTNATSFNQLDFIIERKIREMVNTSALVRIDSCTSSGPSSPAGTVSATPLVAQIDPEGNALPMVSIPRMPHYRMQAGIAAIVLDPVPGDIGVASFCKADSSTVGVGESEPQRPGSFRVFDQADGMLVATVSNAAPQVWVELTQDKTVIIHAPEGCIIETDKNVTINASQSVVMNTPLVTVSGRIQQTGTMGAGGPSEFTGGLNNTGGSVQSNGITLETHVHTGVESGGSTTGGPQ